MCVCMHVCGRYVCARTCEAAHKGQNWVSDSLKLEL